MDQAGLHALTKLRSWFGMVRQHPFVTGVGTVFVAIGLFGDVTSMIATVLSNLDTIVHAPDNLWLRWLFVLAGLGLIAVGVYRTGKAEAAETRLRQDVVDELADRFEQVLKAHGKATHALVLTQKIEIFEKRCDQMKRTAYGKLMSGRDVNPRDLTGREAMESSGNAEHALEKFINPSLNEIGISPIEMPEFPALVLSETGVQGDYAKVAVMADNIDFYMTHNKLSGEIKNAFQKIEGQISNLKEERNELLKELWNV